MHVARARAYAIIPVRPFLPEGVYDPYLMTFRISRCITSRLGNKNTDAAMSTKECPDETNMKIALPYRILSLDGGGAKGFYTLGVLRELEGHLGKRLHEAFDLVFGTSTGAIIASLIGLGYSVAEIRALYDTHVLKVMKSCGAAEKTAALTKLAAEVYGDVGFDTVKMGLGIVATKWMVERPMIFKGSVAQAHGRVGTFIPGFGVKMADAVIASCSAYPFFLRKTVTTAHGDKIELADGGYCANNPSLYAIADAIAAFNIAPHDIRLLSVGVGTYPQPKAHFFSKMWWAKYLESVQLLQKNVGNQYTVHGPAQKRPVQRRADGQGQRYVSAA